MAIKRIQNVDSIDSKIRAIVREEVTLMFQGITAYEEEDEEPEQTQEQSHPTSLNPNGSGGSAPRLRNKRAKKGKGRATNPATDKRFKQNRPLDN